MNKTQTKTENLKKAIRNSIKALLCGVFLLGGLNASAQDQGMEWGINLEAALPIGDMGEAYKFGIGGHLSGEYALQEELALTASLGYLSFGGKSFESGEFSMKIPAFSAVPIRVGGKYYFNGGPVFAQAQVGLAFATGSGDGGSLFLYTPGIGVRFSQFEAALKYEGWSKNGTLSFIGLRAGYFF